MAIGALFNIGWDKILLMYSPSIYDVADVIDTYVYRKSIMDAQFSFAAAIGLFKNVINFIFLYAANKVSNRLTSISLW
jgi:putative aldouronate transport system permease protein